MHRACTVLHSINILRNFFAIDHFSTVHPNWCYRIWCRSHLFLSHRPPSIQWPSHRSTDKTQSISTPFCTRQKSMELNALALLRERMNVSKYFSLFFLFWIFTNQPMFDCTSLELSKNTIDVLWQIDCLFIVHPLQGHSNHLPWFSWHWLHLSVQINVH